MRVTVHRDHLIQLSWMRMLNAYLVREEDGFTLVDTGLSQSAKGIMETIQSYGLPIVRIALTHSHADHAGALDEMARQNPDAAVAFSERTARFLQGDLRLEPDEPQVKLRGSFVRRETQATRLLEPGDRLGSLVVHPAPGHSPDQIAFFDERDGALIAGDAFQTKGRVAVAGAVVWQFPFPGLASWHKETAVESARALAGLNPTLLAVGHGDILEDPAQAMKKAIQEASQG